MPEGTCVGLLGPNGAGKSTTMRLLTAQAIADEGELEVLGRRLPGESKAARAHCGVVPQLDNLDVTLTVEQNLLVFAHLYRVPRHERRGGDRARARDREPRDRRDTAGRQALGRHAPPPADRARARAPAAPVLLDEPTVGLDPQVRQELWALIDALRAEGTTILMSTHYIEEAAAPRRHRADHVARQRRRRRAAGRARRRARGREAVEVYGPPARLAEVEAAADAAGLPHAPDGHERRPCSGVERADGDVPDGERRPTNLEDVFVLLTGEQID